MKMIIKWIGTIWRMIINQNSFNCIIWVQIATVVAIWVKLPLLAIGGVVWVYAYTTGTSVVMGKLYVSLIWVIIINRLRLVMIWLVPFRLVPFPRQLIIIAQGVICFLFLLFLILLVIKHIDLVQLFQFLRISPHRWVILQIKFDDVLEQGVLTHIWELSALRAFSITFSPQKSNAWATESVQTRCQWNCLVDDVLANKAS
jgi:hypothetical protein